MFSAFAAVLLLNLLILNGSVTCQEPAALPHVQYNAVVLQGEGRVCPSTEERRTALANISTDVARIVQESVNSRNCKGSGWTRIAYLDMTDPSHSCPDSWNPISSPKRSCGRLNASSAACDSTSFSASGRQYSQVCGRVIGYEVGHPDAFFSGGGSIDGHYVEGVSITHGNPREHIWTFAAAYDEVRTTWICNCTNINAPSMYTTDFKVPSFVGTDYFCETGVPPGQKNPFKNVFYSEDPLWDGKGCGANSTCCEFNNPPWFSKELPEATTDDIEVRICASTTEKQYEDTPVELVEIYVK